MAVAVGRPAVGAGRGFGVWGGPGGLAAGSPLPACAPAPRPAPNFLGPRLFGAAGSRAAPGGAALGGSPGKGERGRGGSGTPRYGGCGDTRGSRPPARLGVKGRLAVLHPCREGQRVSPLQRGGKKNRRSSPYTRRSYQMLLRVGESLRPAPGCRNVEGAPGRAAPRRPGEGDRAERLASNFPSAWE